MQEYEIIDRIKQLCKERSWTFYRLAKESNITYSTLCTMLHKSNCPSIPTLVKICNAFGISLSQFFCTEEDIPFLTENQCRLLNIWQILSDENRAALEKYMEYLVFSQQHSPTNM